MLKRSRRELIEQLKIEKSEKFRDIYLSEILAIHLTDGSVDLKTIFPGIVCVKRPSMSGLCCRDGIDPANCTGQCPKFLALPRGKDYIRGSISFLLDLFDAVSGPSGALRRRWAAEQLDRFLGVFPKVDSEFSERAGIKFRQNGLPSSREMFEGCRKCGRV